MGRPPTLGGWDMVVALALTVLAYVVVAMLHLFEGPGVFVGPHEWVKANEALLVAVVAALSAAWFAGRRWREALAELGKRTALEAALRSSQARFALAVDGSNDGIWDWDLKTRALYLSPRWKAMVGLTESATGELWLPRIHPEDIESIVAATARLFDGTDDCFECEYRLRHADGSYRWMLTRGVSVRDADGMVCRIAGSQTDITERKRTQLALEEARASLQLATENARIAVWQSDLRALTVRFWSGWKQLLGYDDQEIPLAALWELVHPDDRATATESMQRSLQERTNTYRTEQRILHADGSYRWVLSRGITSYDAAGMPRYVFGADIDITERKALEERLRRSEEQYRNLVEDISDIIYASDCEGRVVYMSPVAERLFGYTPADLVDHHFSEFIFPEDLAEVAEGFREALSGEPQPHDHRVVSKSGKVCWVRNHARSIVEDGKVVGLRGVLSDVTARREAEATLRELSVSLEHQVAERTRELIATHERMRMITDNMSDMVSRISVDAHFEYVSPAHERVLGYAPELLVGASVFDRVHPDDLGRVAAAVGTAIRTASGGQAEFRYRHADGHYVWLETIGRLLFDEQGNPVGAVLTGRDTTERRRAEEVLRESEERFSSAFDFAAIGKALLAPDGRFLRVNRALCELVGYDEEELLERTLYDITHPEDRDVDLDYTRRMVAGEIRTFAREGRYLHKRGQPVWISLSVSLLRDGQGRPLYFISEIQDIDERKKAEAARQEEAEVAAALARVGERMVSSLDSSVLLGRLCEATTDILRCDRGCTLLWKPEERVFEMAAGHGGPPNLWEQLRWVKVPRDLLARIDALEPDAAIEIGVEGQPTDHLQAAFLKALGVRVAVVMPLRRGSDIMGCHVAGFCGRTERLSGAERRIASGIAHLASLALVNTHLFAELTRANQMKSQFVATMSHELRTPLNIIIGYQDLALEGAFGSLNEELTGALGRASKSAGDLLELVEGVLDLSRLETGRAVLQVEEVNLSTLIDGLVREAQLTNGGSAVSVRSVVRAGIPPFQTDRLKLEVVLRNLISNALKFTERGTVTVTARPERGGVEIAVSDSGIGIDPAIREVIFEPFRQGDPGVTRRYGGAGLGLYLVRRLLSVLDGTIAVESEVGRGSTFRVWLPEQPHAATGGLPAAMQPDGPTKVAAA